MQQLGMFLLGIACGLMVSGGVFTALLALGLVPRFAGKTHTGNKILTYESCVVAGCIIGGIASVLPIESIFLKIINMQEKMRILAEIEILQVELASIGFFSGCFVGCVALAIAEMLDSIPIFARRIHFREGLGLAVLSVAAGKVVGSLIYFGAALYMVE
ncbi:MAG: stage V sporulation protein AB [Lachnospiraceae bacterium]|nr:stage V sporulation protein AB [Lachnospiraceae bacterium]